MIHLGHGVPPQDVRTGARRLARALPFTPPGVHLAVVDPGVGSARRALAMRAPATGSLVGPDNGLLVPAAERFGGIDEVVDDQRSPWRLRAGLGHVPRPRRLRPGRGAPRARRAAGRGAASTRSARPARRTEPAPRRRRRIVHVVEVDGFGNVITDARAAATAPGCGSTSHDVVVGPHVRRRRRPAGWSLYEDSAGDVAIAVNGGSAAELLGVRAGDELKLA